MRSSPNRPCEGTRRAAAGKDSRFAAIRLKLCFSCRRARSGLRRRLCESLASAACRGPFLLLVNVKPPPQRHRQPRRIAITRTVP